MMIGVENKEAMENIDRRRVNMLARTHAHTYSAGP